MSYWNSPAGQGPGDQEGIHRNRAPANREKRSSPNSPVINLVSLQLKQLRLAPYLEYYNISIEFGMEQ